MNATEAAADRTIDALAAGRAGRPDFDAVEKAYGRQTRLRWEAVHRRLVPASGLGASQRVVLSALAARGTSYLKELHRDTGLPVGHVARSLAAFRARGLAEPAALPARRGLPDSVRPVRLTAVGRHAVSREVANPQTPSGAGRPSKTPRGPVVGRVNPKENL